MAGGGGDVIKPRGSRWEAGPGLTPPGERIMKADLPLDVSRIGQPLIGDLSDIGAMRNILDAVSQELDSPMDLTLVAADGLKSTMEKLRAAELDRTDAELDFRHIFYNELSPEERDEIVAAHPEIDELIATMNNGYRYTDRRIN